MKLLFLKTIGLLSLLLILPAPALQATEIHTAAAKGDLEAVKKMLEQNPSRLLEMDENGRSALHWACRGVHIELVTYLLTLGADANARDKRAFTPLHNVAFRGHVPAAQALIAAGAIIHAETHDHATALHLAAAGGHTAMAALLLDNGARPDIRDGKEDTPLHAAAVGEKWQVVHLLIDRIPKDDAFVLNLGDFDGSSVLHLACLHGQSETVQRLIARGAGLNLRNTVGQTGYNLAEQKGFKEIVLLLARHGADRGPQKFPILRKPYLGQNVPGNTPQLFAKGIVSTRKGMYGTIVFSPDGREAYWKPEGPEMLFAKMKNGAWCPPQEIPFKVLDARNVPFFSPDGRRLYFMAGLRGAQGKIEKEAIWLVRKTGSRWSEPRPLDPVVNSLAMHWQFSLDRQGHVYMSANGGIRRARFENGHYLQPELLPEPVNKRHPQEDKYMTGEVGPFISPDGDFLIFTRIDARSSRPFQLLISFKRKDGGWSEPLNLSEKLGGPGNDSMAKLSSDGKYLFFQSEREGSGASRGLYWVDAKIIAALRPPDLRPH